MRRARRLGVLAAVGLTVVGAPAACTPPTGGGSGPGWETWRIPAGQHEATASRVELTSTDRLTFRARFDQSAVYTSSTPANQLDVNKLRGVSDCGNAHQTDSARFGWRWDGTAVEISAYTYVAGVRSWTVLGVVQPGAWHDYSLELVGSVYRFTLDGVTTTVPRGCTGVALLKYQLWPYFGGDDTAPHDVLIDIDEN